MEKIKMPVPIAELDGDEMTHVLWGMIKDTLIKPFVDLNTEYYDLSLPHREETADAVTAQAAEAIKRLKIGVKCATITPNLQRQEEYGLTQLWKSPNATIRAALDGTVFRAPDPHLQGQAGGLLLEEAHHHRPSRLRRHLQGRGVPRPRCGQGRDDLHR